MKREKKKVHEASEASIEQPQLKRQRHQVQDGTPQTSPVPERATHLESENILMVIFGV